MLQKFELFGNSNILCLAAVEGGDVFIAAKQVWNYGMTHKQR